MSDDYRGPYTPPSEEPLAFDARRPVRSGGGPAPIALIVSAVVLVAVLAGVFFVYRGGVRGPGDGPRPVGEPVREVKAAPPPEAQPQDPAAGLSVYKEDGAAPAQPTFAPPPETPAPRPAPVTVAVVPPAAPAAKAAPPPVIAAAPVAAAPPAKPAPTPPVKAAAAAPTPKAAAAGVAVVQIGAFSSTQLAEKGWNDAARVAPGAMVGKGKRVEPVTVNGATLYRTAITGFASRDDAAALCDRLKAAGKNCFVK